MCKLGYTKKACTASRAMPDALDWVNRLGTLFGRSGQFKELFHQTARSNHGTSRALKPLCQTRLLDTMPSGLSSEQCDSFLTSLEEMAESKSPTAATANGLQQQLIEGNTVPRLVVARRCDGRAGMSQLFAPKKNTNTSLACRLLFDVSNPT